jgi:hypothetical protein
MSVPSHAAATCACIACVLMPSSMKPNCLEIACVLLPTPALTQTRMHEHDGMARHWPAACMNPCKPPATAQRGRQQLLDPTHAFGCCTMLLGWLLLLGAWLLRELPRMCSPVHHLCRPSDLRSLPPGRQNL